MTLLTKAVLAEKDKLSELMEILSNPSEDEHTHGVNPLDVSTSHPPTVWFLLGLVGGCIAAVFLVSHLNSQKLQSKKTAINKKRAPSSGSPIECLDEEKNA